MLRNRVRQYFQPDIGDSRDFVPLLEGIVADIETVVTSNEKEALLLENTLIKRHQPRFNVNLKDDKNFLVLRLDPEGGVAAPGGGAAAGRRRRALLRPLPLGDVVPRGAAGGEPPLPAAHLHRSRAAQPAAPLPAVPDQALPGALRAAGVARGSTASRCATCACSSTARATSCSTGCAARMKDAAARTEFEVAAEIRDQIRALEVTLEEQRVVSADFVDQDVVGYHREGIALEIVVMSIRAGKLSGNRAFSFTGQEFPDAELISSFVGLYYDMGASVPDEVLLPIEIEDAALKAEWLTEQRAAQAPRRAQEKVEVLVPQRGDRRKLVELARKNAAASFATRRNARADTELALGKLQKRLKLPRLPRAIECYDVSHMQGFATVASMVVFVDGRPEKARYRTYKVRAPAPAAGAATGRTTTSRRCTRCCRGGSGARGRRTAGDDDVAWKLPDLIVDRRRQGAARRWRWRRRATSASTCVPASACRSSALAKEREDGEADGAAAQPAAVAAPVAGADRAPRHRPRPRSRRPRPTRPAPAEPPPTPSEARRQEQGRRRKKPDRVFLPHAKDAIPIRPNSAEMFVLQALRDEAHRFAVSFHRGQRRRLTLRSALSDIPGIGAGPPAPAAAPLRQHQARPRGVGRRAGRRARHQPLRRGGRLRPLGEAAARRGRRRAAGDRRAGRRRAAARRRAGDRGARLVEDRAGRVASARPVDDMRNSR